VVLTTHPYLVPRLKIRAIPLLPLWAFVAGYTVDFTFTFTRISVRGRKVLKLLKYIFSDATFFRLRKTLQVRRRSLEIVGCF
jgi:hypothetical protein